MPRLGACVDTGAPCEYLHWLQAEHLSNLVSFSKVQKLHDHVLKLGPPSLGFWEPQASHMGARGCDINIFKHEGNKKKNYSLLQKSTSLSVSKWGLYASKKDNAHNL